MGSVLSYSGLSTKIRAMQSRLVTDEQLEEIVQLPNVPQVTAYLKRTPEYQNIWSGLSPRNVLSLPVPAHARTSSVLLFLLVQNT